MQRLGRWLGRSIVFCVILWGLTYATIFAVQTFWPSEAELPRDADAILCLGAGAVPRYGGEVRPDEASLRRALTCGRLQVAGVAPIVIFSGGLSGGISSAGEAMAVAAEATGMPSDAARVEGASLSTIQNAAFSRALLPDGAERVVVVSDAFHLPRAWVIFRSLGYQSVGLYASDPLQADQAALASKESPEARWVFRESFAIWFNVARASAYIAGGWIGIDARTRIAWFD